MSGEALVAQRNSWPNVKVVPEAHHLPNAFGNARESQRERAA